MTIPAGTLKGNGRSNPGGSRISSRRSGVTIRRPARANNGRILSVDDPVGQDLDADGDGDGVGRTGDDTGDEQKETACTITW
jgi:ketosteroid isomerase-like protein